MNIDLQPILALLIAHKFVAAGALLCVLFVTMLSARAKFMPTWDSPLRPALGVLFGVAGIVLDQYTGSGGVQTGAYAALSTGIAVCIGELAVYLQGKPSNIPPAAGLLALVFFGNTFNGCGYITAENVKTAVDAAGQFLSDVQEYLALLASIRSIVDAAATASRIPSGVTATLDQLLTAATDSTSELIRAKDAFGIGSTQYLAAMDSVKVAWSTLTDALKGSGVAADAPPDTLRATRASGASYDVVPLLIQHAK